MIAPPHPGRTIRKDLMTMSNQSWIRKSRQGALNLASLFLVPGLTVLVLSGSRPGAGRAEEPGPPPDRAALLAFTREPLRFDSFCFSGDQFPACEFEHPE